MALSCSMQELPPLVPSRTTTDVGTPGLATKVQLVVSSHHSGEMPVYFPPQEKKKKS